MSAPVPDSALRIPFLVRSTTGEPSKDSRLQAEVLALFESSRTGLLRYLNSMGVRDHSAEEVVQEVFLALFQHLRMGRDRRNLRGWVFRVAHNLGLRSRILERRATTPDDESIFERQIDPSPNPEQQLSVRQRQARLLAVFRVLPEQERCCLNLRSEGLRYREIAETLGISVAGVAQSLARSLERLQRADGKI